jgi:amidase
MTYRPHEILSLSGTAQGRLLARGDVSSGELIDTHLAKIHDLQPALNAAVEVLEESARREAREADSRRATGRRLGPLDGVPFSVKDSIEVAGTVCSAGTLGYRNAPPSTQDAALVAALRGAGAIPIARTNLPDLLFAFESDNLIYGRTNNPYDVRRTCGGSSGGEAALIAACGSPFGLGSDAAGSVRLPAHFCGVAALKPTSGRLSRAGHVPPPGGWIETLWQIGPIARRVEDLCTLMPILLAARADRTVVPMPHGDPGAVPMDTLRVAFFTDNGIVPADAGTAAVVLRAADVLAAQGARVVPARPPGIEQSYELEMKWIGPDGGDALRRFLLSIGSFKTHPLLEGWLEKLEPFRTSLDGFGGYWADLDRFRSALSAFLEDYDAVLSPVCSGPALLHGTSTSSLNFPGFSYTMTYNLTGWPAAVVRCGESAEGLPIAVQIAARPWREDVALAVAARLEALMGGWLPPRCSSPEAAR